jgi:hypothetical protein
MADDLIDQLIKKINEREFRLQLDDATDTNKDTHLICYVRFIDDDDMVEDLLFCKNITASVKAQDLFDILNNFMSKNMFDWPKCFGVCTDGACSMSSS